MGYIFCIIGKSSTGKDTIYQKLLNKNPAMFNRIITYTTRPMREGEKNGKEYYFVTEEILDDYEKRKQIIEVREYFTIQGVWKYFTVKDMQIYEDKKIYLLVGTIELFLSLRSFYGSDKVFPIYIEVDDVVRIKRAIKRETQQINPDIKEVCRRFLADSEDFSETNIQSCGIDKRFINNDIEKTVEDIYQYIMKRRRQVL